jgi:hypothetical protein
MSVTELFKALYDFRAEEPDELSMLNEEVFEIISKEQVSAFIPIRSE